MRTIISIEYVDVRKKGDREYTLTYAILDDGTEARGFGEFKVGDKVECFFEEKYNHTKMQKGAHNARNQNDRRNQ